MKTKEILAARYIESCFQAEVDATVETYCRSWLGVSFVQFDERSRFELCRLLNAYADDLCACDYCGGEGGSGSVSYDDERGEEYDVPCRACNGTGHQADRVTVRMTDADAAQVAA